MTSYGSDANDAKESPKRKTEITYQMDDVSLFTMSTISKTDPNNARYVYISLILIL